jgi:Transcriptional regulator, AbiEi antitoxin
MGRKAGVFRPRELDRVGIPRQYLRQAKDRGLVRQVGRGLYVVDGSRVTEHHTLVEAAKRVPHGVVCEETRCKFARFRPAAVVESGDRTQRSLSLGLSLSLFISAR